MTRMVPSQVVSAIDQMFPHVKQKAPRRDYTRDDKGGLMAIAALVNEIPPELLVLPAPQYAELRRQLALISYQVDYWKGGGMGSAGHLSEGDPIAIFREVLSLCPDEYPPEATADLAFISDTDLRTSIRNDVGAAGRALHNGEWKAATVLAGGAIEALLHWVLGEKKTAADRAAAGSALVAQRILGTTPNTDLDRWDLHQFIEVAAHLGLIKPESVIAANLARDYRNLIHPGRAKRLAQVCDRATAFSAMAGLEHVVRDLK